MSDPKEKPRQQYYSLAHQVLPEIFFNDPPRLLNTLEDDGVDFLQYLWKRMGEHAQENDHEAAKSLDVELSQHGETSLALIVLPRPERVTEAYFIALLYRPAPPEQQSYARFITLEHGTNLDGTTRTVLGEWDPKKIHRYFGDGPPATRIDFLKAILEQFLP